MFWPRYLLETLLINLHSCNNYFHFYLRTYASAADENLVNNLMLSNKLDGIMGCALVNVNDSVFSFHVDVSSDIFIIAG